jgi:hypothetical protein
MTQFNVGDKVIVTYSQYNNDIKVGDIDTIVKIDNFAGLTSIYLESNYIAYPDGQIGCGLSVRPLLWHQFVKNIQLKIDNVPTILKEPDTYKSLFDKAEPEQPRELSNFWSKYE